jgi:hypothetical protein
VTLRPSIVVGDAYSPGAVPSAKADSKPENKPLRRWPEGQLYPSLNAIEFFSSLESVHYLSGSSRILSNPHHAPLKRCSTLRGLKRAAKCKRHL